MSEDPTQGQGSTAASEPGPPDIADDEELDVVIEGVAPRRRRGMGGGAWVLIIILLAAAALVAGLFMKRQADETARKARESRALTYKTQEAGIEGTIDEAATLAEKGEVDAALKLLDAAAEKWAQLAGSANGSKDVEDAKRFASQQSRLKSAIDDLAKDRDEVAKLSQQIAELTAQRTALSEGVRDKIRAISGKPPVAGSETAPAPAAAGEAPANEAPAAPGAEAGAPPTPALEMPSQEPPPASAAPTAPAPGGEAAPQGG